MTQAAHEAEEALHAPADRRPARPITFTVDGEPIQTTEHRLTPNQILGLAGIDPASHYLVQVKGRQQVSYQGKGEEPITVHEHAVFVSVSTGPTPTS
jgi:hypothetical protein